MIFTFLKYIQPTHYFGLSNRRGKFIFPLVEELPDLIKKQLVPNPYFKSESARQYDRSWRAIQMGYIADNERITEFKKLPLEDEYRFIRTYFNPLWATYILILRIVGLKNPLKEIRAWFSTRKTHRIHVTDSPILYADWEDFDAPLLKKYPKVSVIIPTLNRYPYLKDALADLEKQKYKNFEVIVIDQSEPFQEEFYRQFDLDLHVIQQEEEALWLARNTAIHKSESDLLLFFDDDSRVEADWIQMHLKCLDFFNADISSGVSISLVGAEIPKHYSFFKISDQLDTGNALIKKEVFKEIDLYDRQFEKQRMGDGEFGLRAYLNGCLNVSNPFAGRLHLKVETGGLRQMGSWDGFRSQKWFGPLPIPSVLYFFRKYFGNYRTSLALLKLVPPSVMPYKYKKSKKMMLLGGIISLIILPLLAIRICRSWHLASIKLKEGPRIEEL